MKQTSLEGWAYAKRNLGERQGMVYDALVSHGPATGQELDVRLGNGAWKRCSELEKLGLIEVITERKCTITGRNAGVWAVVNRQGKLF